MPRSSTASRRNRVSPSPWTPPSVELDSSLGSVAGSIPESEHTSNPRSDYVSNRSRRRYRERNRVLRRVYGSPLRPDKSAYRATKRVEFDLEEDETHTVEDKEPNIFVTFDPSKPSHNLQAAQTGQEELQLDLESTSSDDTEFTEGRIDKTEKRLMEELIDESRRLQRLHAAVARLRPEAIRRMMRTAEIRLASNEEPSSRSSHATQSESRVHRTEDSPTRVGSRYRTEGSLNKLGSRYKTEESPNKLGSRHRTEDSPIRVGSRHSTEGAPIRIGSRHRTEGSPIRIGSRHSTEGSPIRVGSIHSTEGSPIRIRSRHRTEGSPNKKYKSRGTQTKNKTKAYASQTENRLESCSIQTDNETKTIGAQTGEYTAAKGSQTDQNNEARGMQTELKCTARGTQMENISKATASQIEYRTISQGSQRELQTGSFSFQTDDTMVTHTAHTDRYVSPTRAAIIKEFLLQQENNDQNNIQSENSFLEALKQPHLRDRISSLQQQKHECVNPELAQTNLKRCHTISGVDVKPCGSGSGPRTQAHGSVNTEHTVKGNYSVNENTSDVREETLDTKTNIEMTTTGNTDVAKEGKSVGTDAEHNQEKLECKSDVKDNTSVGKVGKTFATVSKFVVKVRKTIDRGRKAVGTGSKVVGTGSKVVGADSDLSIDEDDDATLEDTSYKIPNATESRSSVYEDIHYANENMPCFTKKTYSPTNNRRKRGIFVDERCVTKRTPYVHFVTGKTHSNTENTVDSDEDEPGIAKDVPSVTENKLEADENVPVDEDKLGVVENTPSNATEKTVSVTENNRVTYRDESCVIKYVPGDIKNNSDDTEINLVTDEQKPRSIEDIASGSKENPVTKEADVKKFVSVHTSTKKSVRMMSPSPRSKKKSGKHPAKNAPDSTDKSLRGKGGCIVM